MRAIRVGLAAGALVFGLACDFEIKPVGPAPDPEPPTISGPPVTLEVSPDAAKIRRGEILYLTATYRDAAGRLAVGPTVRWFSSQPQIVAVNPAGEAQGMREGWARVTARGGGLEGSSSVTVTLPPAAAGPCGEPRPTWIWCDDFELDRLASYSPADTHADVMSRAWGFGAGNSWGLRVRFAPGQVYGGLLRVGFGRTPPFVNPVDSGTGGYRDIYWRFLVRLPLGWPGAGDSLLLSAAHVLAVPALAQAAVATVRGGTGAERDHLVAEARSGTDEAGTLLTRFFDHVAAMRFLGAPAESLGALKAENAGWFGCVEGHVRLNDPGQSNGVFEMWAFGFFRVQLTALNWVGAYADYAINAVDLAPAWPGGAPQSVELHFDNFVVATQRIGCS
jgi:hypothetical protein